MKMPRVQKSQKNTPPLFYNGQEVCIFYNSLKEFQFAPKKKLETMQTGWKDFFSALLFGNSIFGHFTTCCNFQTVLIIFKEQSRQHHGLDWDALRDGITRKTNLKVLRSPKNCKQVICHLDMQDFQQYSMFNEVEFVDNLLGVNYPPYPVVEYTDSSDGNCSSPDCKLALEEQIPANNEEFLKSLNTEEENGFFSLLAKFDNDFELL